MSFENLILELIPGESPSEKHFKIVQILRIIQEVGYPCRGTEEENKTIEDFALEIQTLKLVEQ